MDSLEIIRQPYQCISGVIRALKGSPADSCERIDDAGLCDICGYVPAAIRYNYGRYGDFYAVLLCERCRRIRRNSSTVICDIGTLMFRIDTAKKSLPRLRTGAMKEFERALILRIPNGTSLDTTNISHMFECLLCLNVPVYLYHGGITVCGDCTTTAHTNITMRVLHWFIGMHTIELMPLYDVRTAIRELFTALSCAI